MDLGHPEQVYKLALWVMTLSIVAITLCLTAAGATQVLLQRLSDTPLSFMETQDRIMPIYWARWVCGISFFCGLVLYVISFFVTGKREE